MDRLIDIFFIVLRPVNREGSYQGESICISPTSKIYDKLYKAIVNQNKIWTVSWAALSEPERQGRVHIGFAKCLHSILNWTDCKCDGKYWYYFNLPSPLKGFHIPFKIFFLQSRKRLCKPKPQHQSNHLNTEHQRIPRSFLYLCSAKLRKQ